MRELNVTSRIDRLSTRVFMSAKDAMRPLLILIIMSDWLTDWSIAWLSHQPPLRFFNFLVKSVTYQHISHIKVISITIINNALLACWLATSCYIPNWLHISLYSTVLFHWSQLFPCQVFFIQHPVTIDTIQHCQLYWPTNPIKVLLVYIWASYLAVKLSSYMYFHWFISLALIMNK